MMNYSARLKKLQKTIQNMRCDLLIIEDVIDIYYMTGIELSTGKLFVDLQEASLFVDSRYYEHCQKLCPFNVILLEDSTIENWFCEKNFSLKIGCDSTKTSYENYLEWRKQLKKFEIRAGPSAAFKLVPLKGPLRILRCIKDADEIILLKKAAALGSEGFDFVYNSIIEGISEKELAIELEIFWKRKGSKSLGFDPIIAFGTHSSMPHYRPDQTTLKKGENVLIDIGVNLEHYHSDMTRVIYFGTPHKKIQEIYSIVLEAQRRALQLCKPGTLIGELDRTARDYIQQKGYGNYFTHGLGHGVGLEIHEAPSLRQNGIDHLLKLQEGMVITIEPGIYLPDVGGVRIEDTVAITATGHENLTNRPS